MHQKRGIATAVLAVGLVSGLLSPAVSLGEDENPYTEVRLTRLSLIEGEVLLQRGDDEEWVAASVNTPLRPHDKLWTSDDARAEVQLDDGSIVRLAENTNLDILDLEQGWTHLQLTLGVANFVALPGTRVKSEETFFEVDSPQVAVQVSHSSRFRMDVAEDGSTEITVREGRIELSSDEEPIVVSKNQRVVIEGSESPRYLLESVQEEDEWDQWNEDRDRQLAKSRSREHLYPDIYMGSMELDLYGRWTMIAPYGWVWIPPVTVGWVPYQTGRWVWIEPWGWTWVSYEPWGWVPYHYGRWVVVGNLGWVWVPGSRMIWAPGYVRFIYGPDWVAWVPLAPGEVYYYNPGVSVHIEVNLINYRVPGAVIIVPRQTFVTGVVVKRRFVAPRDPIRAGRVAVGPPPIVPTRASLQPVPDRVVKAKHLPPPIIHRPVVYLHPPSKPPARFEHRRKEIQEAVKQGRPPIVATPRIEQRRPPVIEERGTSEKVHKDITVRKAIPGMGKEQTRPSHRPPVEKRAPRPPEEPAQPGGEVRGGQPRLPKQFEVDQKPTEQSKKPKSLYRKPPKPQEQPGEASPEKQGGPDKERGRPNDR